MVSAPELIPPSEWMPMIFGEAHVWHVTFDQFQGIVDQIIALHNTINDAVLDPPAVLPLDCPLWENVLDNFTDTAPIAQWSRGFLHGHLWLEDLWEETVPQALNEEFRSALLTLSFFSSRKTSEAFHAEVATGGQSFAMMAAEIHRVLPAAVAQYAHMGRSVLAKLAAPAVEDVDRARRAMVGRNESCPCGSGKKYKKCCCGATVH